MRPLVGSLLVIAGIAKLAAAIETSLDRALCDAAGRGQTELVASLLKQGADPNFDGFGMPPLHRAARSGHVDTVKLLIEHGAKVGGKDREGRSALAAAVGWPKSECVKALMEAGAKPDGFALGQAGWLGRMEAVKLFLDNGADPNAGLVRAAQGGHGEIVQLLLDRGASVGTTAESADKSTALHMAALQGGQQTTQILLQRGADPNLLNDAGKTPLHLAIAGNCDLATVKLLVNAGAKLDVADMEGITPVRLAALAGRSGMEVYDWLVAASGGKEPGARRADSDPDNDKATRELLAALSSSKGDERMAAQRALVLRGKSVVADVMLAIESGEPIERYFGLLAALGPDAETARPELESMLGEKGRVFGAAVTLDRIKPGALDALSKESKARAAAALASGLADRELDMIGSYHLALLNRFGEVSAPQMLTLLRSPHGETRRRAASSLRTAEYDSTELASELLKLAKEDSDGAVRTAAIRTLSRFGQPSQDLKAFFLSLMKNPPPQGTEETAGSKLTPFQAWSNDSHEAARSLARFGPTVIDDLLPLLSPIGAPQRGPAITALVSLGAPAVPALIKLLGHEDSAVAISAGVALNRIGTPAVDALAEAVRTGNERIVEHGANALWWIGPSAKAALPILLELAGSDKKPDAARTAALRAALKIDAAACRETIAVPQLVSVLIRSLEHGTFKEQGWAAEAAGGFGPVARDTLPALQKRLELPAADFDTGGLGRDYVQRQAREAIDVIAAIADVSVQDMRGK